jgi:hypothetical protein
MNAENLDNTKNDRELPSVRFFIESSPLGLAAGFDPEAPIAGTALIGLLGAGIWALVNCVARETDVPKEGIWDMVEATVNMIKTEIPDMGGIREEGGFDNEIRHE